MGDPDFIYGRRLTNFESLNFGIEDYVVSEDEINAELCSVIEEKIRRVNKTYI
jgi:hypothetical protein